MIVAKIPVTMFVTIGVPSFDNLPMAFGADPSSAATAYARFAPISQAIALVSTPMITAPAEIQPRNSPNPDRVGVPPGLTLPPQTVKTALIASRKPAEARDLRGGQHQQDREDRSAVQQNGKQERPERGGRHILLRVLHLVARVARDLEARVVEEQDRTRPMNPTYVGMKSLPPTPPTPFLNA